MRGYQGRQPDLSLSGNLNLEYGANPDVAVSPILFFCSMSVLYLYQLSLFLTVGNFVSRLRSLAGFSIDFGTWARLGLSLPVRAIKIVARYRKLRMKEIAFVGYIKYNIIHRALIYITFPSPPIRSAFASPLTGHYLVHVPIVEPASMLCQTAPILLQSLEDKGNVKQPSKMGHNSHRIRQIARQKLHPTRPNARAEATSLFESEDELELEPEDEPEPEAEPEAEFGTESEAMCAR